MQHIKKIFKRKILSQSFSCVEHLMMEERNTVMINRGNLFSLLQAILCSTNQILEFLISTCTYASFPYAKYPQPLSLQEQLNLHYNLWILSSSKIMRAYSAKHSNCSLLISRGQNPKSGRRKITAHLSLYESWIKDRRTEKGTVCHKENTRQQTLKSQRNVNGLGIAEMCRRMWYNRKCGKLSENTEQNNVRRMREKGDWFHKHVQRQLEWEVLQCLQSKDENKKPGRQLSKTQRFKHKCLSYCYTWEEGICISMHSSIWHFDCYVIQNKSKGGLLLKLQEKK